MGSIPLVCVSTAWTSLNGYLQELFYDDPRLAPKKNSWMELEAYMIIDWLNLEEKRSFSLADSALLSSHS